MNNLFKSFSITTILCCLLIVKVSGQCTAPLINSFTPNTGFIGSTITITGGFFNTTPANNVVYFGATRATVLTASFGTLTVTAPIGASTALISVTNTACNLTGYSSVPFNGIFCPTPLDANTYANTAFDLAGIAGAYNMLTQDMDGDGKPEIISCLSGITVAKNNSTPGVMSFQAFTFGGGGSHVATADFDGDGKRDIMSANTIYRNNSTGPGSISFQTFGGYGGYQGNAGDFNNDGKIDIIAGNNLYRNTSTGPGVISFALAGSISNFATGIQCADVDGDGKTDILYTEGGGNRAITFRNTTAQGATNFTFEAPEYWPSIGLYPYRCQIADFDKDGRIDLCSPTFSSSTNTTNTTVWRNLSTIGNIVFGTANNYPGPNGNYRIAVGDVDGDGYPDIVTKSIGFPSFDVYRNQSSGPGSISFATRFTYPAAAGEVSGITIGDLDGDFVPDISTSGISSNRILVHRNTSVQVDITNPTALCKNIIVALSPSGTVNVTAAMIDNGSSDACGIAQLLINGQASINFTCADIGPNNVTLTVIDNSNNQATCNAVVTVAPAAIIVAGQTTVCQGQTVLLTANLGDSYQWYKDGIIIGGATNQTYTATTSGAYTVAVSNAGGCSGTSAPTTVTVNNNPTVNVTPSGTTFLCPPGNNALLTASLSSIYQWKLNGTNIPNATQQTYTATVAGSYTVQVIDLFGCSATSDPVVVVANPPEIDITGNAVSIVDGDNTPSTTDDTDFETTFPSTPVVKTYTINNTGTGALTVNSISMTGAQASNYTVGGITLPATIAAAGGSATFTVTFLGTSIQVYTAEVVVNNNDCDEAVYNFAVKAEISCVAASFSDCPTALSADTDPGLCSAVVSYTATATGTPTPTITHEFSGATEHPAGTAGTGSGSTFNKGVTNVVITASNGCGNNATCSFTVTVNDTENPVITCPSNISVNNDPNQCGAIVNYAVPVGTDNCPGAITTLTAGLPPGSLFPVGTTTVTYTVTKTNNLFYDEFANNNNGWLLGPEWAIAPTAINNCGNSCTGSSDPQFDHSGSNDNKIAGVVPGGCASTQLHDFYFLTSPVINTNVPGTVMMEYWRHLHSDYPGYAVNIIEVFNGSTWVRLWQEPPSGICFNDLNWTLHAFNITAYKNANFRVRYGFNITSGGVYIMPSWSIDDFRIYSSGTGTQSASCSFTVTVTDNEAPSITCAAAQTQTADAGVCNAAVTVVGPATGDNCGVASVTNSYTNTADASGTYPVGTTTVTWTVTDIHGNTNTCTQDITVTDDEDPSITCPANKTSASDAGLCTKTFTAAEIGSATASDNCSYTISWSRSDAASSLTTPYQFGVTTITWTATDAAGNTATCNQTITIDKVTTTTTVTVNPNEQQYSDKVTFVATVTPSNCAGAGPIGGTVTFKIESLIGSLVMGSAPVLADGTATLSNVALLEEPSLAPGNPPNGPLKPGVKTVTAEYSGTDPDYEVTNPTTSLTISCEDARSYYTGACYASTSSPTSSSAIVTLSATIKDISATLDAAGDVCPGDIRNATVRFVNKDKPPSDPLYYISPVLNVGLVNLADVTVGTVTHNWNVTIINDAQQFTIGMIVNNYYCGDNPDGYGVVTVAKPLGDLFITGGGYLVLTNSAGIKAGTAGTKNNFGFNVKYNKAKTNLQGNINTIVRRMEGTEMKVYQIKGNVMTSLAVNPNCPKTATFNGKANITDITIPNSPQPVDGNATLQVKMTDMGEPGSSDKIAITVWNKNGGLWFASNWNGTTTVEQVLGGGNLKVHGGAACTSSRTINEPITSNNIEVVPEPTFFNVKAYPNPTENEFTLVVEGGSNEKVQIMVYDAIGILVKKIEKGEGKSPIRFGEDLKVGAYIVEVRQGINRKTIKLVKMD